jgi:putative PIN family toxin of toxin-antitoxin system
MISRVVYDCMIYLQAAANETGAAGECLRQAEIGRVELCISPAVTAELRDVITRPKTLKKFRTLTPELVRKFFRRLAGCSVLVTSVPQVVTPIRDPKDEKYLNLAVAANASVIVSRDNDLLDLMKPDDPDGIAFRTAHPTIAILDPVAFLATLPSA